MSAKALGKAELREGLVAREPGDHKGIFGHVLVVAGSRGMAGAAILAARGALRSGAGLVAAAALEDARVAALEPGSALVVEDLDRGIADEQALFHLLNRARESKLAVLITSRIPPGEQEFQVPDLRSRLRALLLQGAESAPGQPADRAYFDTLRDRVQQRTRG